MRRPECRPRWLDDPDVFSPWQTRYLHRLRCRGLLTFTLRRSLPLPVRRLVDQGYVRVVKRNKGAPGWWEATLTAAGQKIFRRKTYSRTSRV